MEEQKFTIEQFRNYLLQCESFGDALYYLNEEEIILRNKKQNEQNEQNEQENIEHYT